MKHISLLTLVIFVCFIVFLIASSDENDKSVPPQFPLGQNVGSVEFDCVIELAAPDNQNRNVFFLRYQVSPTEIAYDIHWVEPAWQHVDFPYPPFGLSMYADDSQFILYSSWNDKRWEHTFHEKRPETFNFTLGNYFIESQRHYYSESLLGRVYAEDIGTITSRRSTYLDSRGLRALGNPVARSESRRELSINNFAFSADHLQFGVHLRKEPRQYKELVYWFSDNRLEKHVGHLRERVVPVGGFEIQVTSHDFPDGITITQLPAKYHEGDRGFEVFFADVEVGTETVNLPEKIEVRNSRITDIEIDEFGTEKEIVMFPRSFLRGATLSNYRHVEKMTTPATIGSIFLDAPFFDEEQKFRRLSIEYWLKKPDDVPDAIRQWYGDFADQCLDRYAVSEFFPDRLRLIHMAIISDLHTGNVERIEKQTFAMHLSELTDNGFQHIAVSSQEQFLDLCRQWDVPVHLPLIP